ncbi:hypothetical protein GHT06_008666 [Daphnia sinensis]|uniref:Caspase-8 n=1 Tax=Daphnia sinensis TaxID=1820382 RepID=A0AAD5LLI6_9CRUS|nr:hypothetical protein GHT06_008666 [Daphnia sinensis]
MAENEFDETKRLKTSVTLEEKAQLIKQPKETTSIDREEREPVRKGGDCKLFRICTGKIKDGSQYLDISHHQKGKNLTSENKRPIYKGYYNCDVPVAILKINYTQSGTTRTTQKEIERELQILEELEVHENFIRYFTHEMDDDFVYIATELCLCSVEDLLDPAFEKHIPMKKEILKELQAKEILRQATRGLNYLHQNDFVHRNIKPNNFLIKDVKCCKNSCHFVIKITDFRLTRKYNPDKDSQLSGSAASQGWEAPESKNTEKHLSTKLDVFILGCFYHYVLVALSKTEANKGKPRHPFGDNAEQRRKNISEGQQSVQDLPFVPNDKDEDEKEVAKLIKSMLKFNEEDRPTLQQVLASPYFMPSEDYNIYKFATPGLCVIFNQEEFENGEVRQGSDKDRDKLKEIFNELGFKTLIYNNLDSYALKTEIKSLAKKDLKNYGCLVVCLLSHGIENAILCYDGRYVNTNELKYEFSLDKCPSLYGKPKIFIVQACQGSLEQSKTGTISHKNSSSGFSQRVTRIYEAFVGPLGTPSRTDMTKKDVEPNYNKEDLEQMIILDNARKNPPLMDFLTINSTLHGFKVYRFYNQEGFLGSFFIQSLCKALFEEYLDKRSEGTKHLEDLLRCVKVNINARSEEVENKSDKEEEICCWQTMPWEVCLSKHIRFCKSEIKGTDIPLNDV